MHTILDLHGLADGINNQTIGERVGGLDWWWNETAPDWSMKTVDAVLGFVQQPGPSFIPEPINEPMDNPGDIGKPTALSEKVASWLFKYYNTFVGRAADVKSQITAMLDDGFKGGGYWVANFTRDKYIVFDLHYCNYFNGRPAGSTNVTEMICADAKRSRVGKFPAFTGESSIETLCSNFGRGAWGHAERRIGGFWEVYGRERVLDGKSGEHGEGCRPRYGTRLLKLRRPSAWSRGSRVRPGAFASRARPSARYLYNILTMQRGGRAQPATHDVLL